jgi:hypothetical protein
MMTKPGFWAILGGNCLRGLRRIVEASFEMGLRGVLKFYFEIKILYFTIKLSNMYIDKIDIS